MDWSIKRRSDRGRTDTHVSAWQAARFVTGEPSGLVTTLDAGLGRPEEGSPVRWEIMLGLDQGGAYINVFNACRAEHAHWVTWCRAPLAVPRHLPVLAKITVNGKTWRVAWVGESVQVKNYGSALQLTLSEKGSLVL